MGSSPSSPPRRIRMLTIPERCRLILAHKISSTRFDIPGYRKIDLRIFGDRNLRGDNDVQRPLPWRTALRDLVLRGALSLIVCAFAALCVCGGLSALAANSKERSNYGDQA